MNIKEMFTEECEIKKFESCGDDHERQAGATMRVHTCNLCGALVNNYTIHWNWHVNQVVAWRDTDTDVHVGTAPYTAIKSAEAKFPSMGLKVPATASAALLEAQQRWQAAQQNGRLVPVESDGVSEERLRALVAKLREHEAAHRIYYGAHLAAVYQRCVDLVERLLDETDKKAQ